MLRGKRNGTLLMRMVCAIFFLSFAFFYLYNYQCDVLALAQHVLSGGATHYSRTVGAVLITAVLWLIQLGLWWLTGLSRRAHALTYLPSLLILGIITDISPDIATAGYIGSWAWVFPLLMLPYAFVVWVARQLEEVEPRAGKSGLFSRMVWLNLLQMVVMASITCAIGNSDPLFHYRMRMESDIASGRFAEATAVGRNDVKTDSSLTMLRVYALSRQGRLGESLFEYPLVGGSDAMLPNGHSVKLLMASEKDLYAELGVVFAPKPKPRRYLELLQRSRYAKPASRDWLLCAYLLDGDLNSFVKALPRYYDLSGHLPKAYREALILYTHLRPGRMSYHSPEMDADFEDFRAIARRNADPTIRKSKLKEDYGTTYWYYYRMLK